MYRSRSSPAAVDRPFAAPALFDINFGHRRESSPDADCIIDPSPLPWPRVRPSSSCSTSSSSSYRHSPEYRHLYEIRPDLSIAFEDDHPSDSNIPDPLTNLEGAAFTHVVALRTQNDSSKPSVETLHGPQPTLVLRLPPIQDIGHRVLPSDMELSQTYDFISGAGIGVSLNELATTLYPAEVDANDDLSVTFDQLREARNFITAAGYSIDPSAVDSHPKVLVTVPRGRKIEGMAVIVTFLAWMAQYRLRDVVDILDEDEDMALTPWHGLISLQIRRHLERDLNFYYE